MFLLWKELIARKGFNTSLYLTLATGLLCGCQSAESRKKKDLCTLDIHIESTGIDPEHNKAVPISREHPFTINIQKSSFLTQNDVDKAKVIDVVGGFALWLQFSREGTWLLEQYSTGNVGKHFVIFSQFTTPEDEKLHKGRWLAAPIIKQRISNGILVFTPDATREEAEQIVLGLNNVAKDLGKKNKESKD